MKINIDFLINQFKNELKMAFNNIKEFIIKPQPFLKQMPMF